MKNSINRANLASIRSIVYTVLTLVMLFSAGTIASASPITASMSAEVAAEFTKQLNLQTSPSMSRKLIMMKNPYKKFLKVINKKVGDETNKGYEANYGRRLMTHDESTLKAKFRRFKTCQRTIVYFMGFASKAKRFAREVSKEEVMEGNVFGVDYPFTQEQAKDDNMRPSQIALELGWQYQGQGEAHVETFLSTCLAIPIKLYYWPDKFRD